MGNQETVIEINGVHKAFKELKAVDGVSTQIKKGEFVALLGPNGAGKTTLIEMIEGLQFPDRGEILLFGKTWQNNERFLHSQIGLSLQETKFIDKLTVSETLSLFASFHALGDARISEILEQVNLETKKKSYVVNLSGGQRQRLALGIALLNHPRILLLDEPTTGLDPGARRDIWDILMNLKKNGNTSMILTTHYMEEAEYLCDRILILDKGKIIAGGTFTELLAAYGEGDMISIHLQQASSQDFERAIKSLKKSIWEVPNQKGKLIVSNLTEALIEIINFTNSNQLQILHLESRKITLDDLFLHLTGRKLYE